MWYCVCVCFWRFVNLKPFAGVQIHFWPAACFGQFWSRSSWQRAQGCIIFWLRSRSKTLVSLLSPSAFLKAESAELFSQKKKKKTEYTPINKIWLSAYRWYFIQLIGHFKWGPEAEPVWLFQEDLFSLRKVPFAFLAPGLKNRKDFAGLSWIDILQSYQKLCLSIITYSDVEHVI